MIRTNIITLLITLIMGVCVSCKTGGLVQMVKDGRSAAYKEVQLHGTASTMEVKLPFKIASEGETYPIPENDVQHMSHRKAFVKDNGILCFYTIADKYKNDDVNKLIEDDNTSNIIQMFEKRLQSKGNEYSNLKINGQKLTISGIPALLIDMTVDSDSLGKKKVKMLVIIKNNELWAAAYVYSEDDKETEAKVIDSVKNIRVKG